MRETQQTAKTVEEAVEQGLQILGVTRPQVEVEVLEEPSGGILGIGGRQAKVRLVVQELNVEKAVKLLEDILDKIGAEASVDVLQNEDFVRFEISGEDPGLLIGHRGETLNAIQFLLQIVLGKGLKERKVRCIVDVEGYRVRREKALEVLAENMARKAVQERRTVTLEPMLSHERRVIHLALQKNSQVTTSSSGRDPFRKVVISPAEGRKEGKRAADSFKFRRARGGR